MSKDEPVTHAEVRIQLLGPIRAWRDNQAVALRGASSRTVLAALALRQGTVISVQELSEALWGEEAPANPVANVQSVVSRLRRSLGTDVIETIAPGYRLAREVATDLGDLEALLAELDGAEPVRGADQLAAALARWDGPALEDTARTLWFGPDRTRLGELRLRVIDRRHAILLATGQVDRALIDLSGDARAAPLRESTQLLLMEALHLTDRNAEALRVADGYRRALLEETGLDPSPALAELEGRVLDGATIPVQRLRQGAARRGRSRWLPPDTPFVGRDQELERLIDLTEHHRLVTVVGTGGVGKTRLVMELLEARFEDPVVVLLAAIEPDATVDVVLAAELGLESTPDSPIDALVERLELRPTLVVLDNCEHVLDNVRDLVDELLRRVDGLSLLATSRHRLGLPEEQLMLLDSLTVPTEADIDAPPVQLFIDRVIRAAPLEKIETTDAAVFTDICRILCGLPLALEVAAARVHLLGLDELRRQLVAGHLPQTSGPRTMEKAVAWSLDLLGPDARRLFGEVCIFPGSFAIDGIEAISALDDPTAALAELVDASLLTVEAGPTHHSYRILEPIRQVGSTETPHEAVDSYLGWAVDLGADLERLRGHWETAGMMDLLASHRDDFRHAFSLLTATGDDERGGCLAMQLAEALAIRPEPELVGLILERAPDNADGLLARAILEWGVGRVEECVDHSEGVADLVGPSDQRWPIAWRSAAPAFSFLGEIDKMIDAARRTVDHPASTDIDRVSGVGLWALGECYRGDPDAARRVLTDQAALLRSGSMAFISFVRAEIASATDTNEALAWLAEGAEQALRDTDFLLARMIEIAQLALLVRIGHRREAARLARPLIEEMLIAGMIPQAWMSLRHVAALLAHTGEHETAALILDSAGASPRATQLVGDAIIEEAALRQRIQDELNTSTGIAARDLQTLSIGDLWPEVETALRRSEATQLDGS